MSVCTFLAANIPLPEILPKDDEDDSFFLFPFDGAGLYTNQKHVLLLEWDCTEEQGSQLIQYLREALRSTEAVELWHVWLVDGWDYEDRPVFRRATLSINDLLPEHLRELDDKEVLDGAGCSTAYCLSITKTRK
ncbi:MAG: hypothetical protein LUF80_00115 [Oscillospiraceae bacterium]|nr:hypothetical protein [Oscillospiraceae bacterium]